MTLCSLAVECAGAAAVCNVLLSSSFCEIDSDFTRLLAEAGLLKGRLTFPAGLVRTAAMAAESVKPDLRVLPSRSRYSASPGDNCRQHSLCDRRGAV